MRRLPPHSLKIQSGISTLTEVSGTLNPQHAQASTDWITFHVACARPFAARIGSILNITDGLGPVRHHSNDLLADSGIARPRPGYSHIRNRR